MAASETQAFLGWDVGGTKSAAVIGLSDGRSVDRVEWPSLAAAGPGPMLAAFLSHARPLHERHTGVAGVGVSIGGPLDSIQGVVKSPPHLPGWDDVPLKRILAEEFKLPVFVEHDAAACLLAEWLWGAARGATHAIYLTCGTGCGAGILIDGRILRGPRGQSPEAGHIRLADDGPEVFGKAGCVESFCGGEGMSKLAPFRFPDHFPGPVDPRRLNELAAGGDERARAVLSEAAGRTGHLCALLTDLFSPQVIVLGSMSLYLPAWWLEQVRLGFRQEVLPANAADTRIIPNGLGRRLQDLSAVAPCVTGGR